MSVEQASRSSGDNSTLLRSASLWREGARLGMEAYTEVKYVCRDYR